MFGETISIVETFNLCQNEREFHAVKSRLISDTKKRSIHEANCINDPLHSENESERGSRSGERRRSLSMKEAKIQHISQKLRNIVK